MTENLERSSLTLVTDDQEKSDGSLVRRCRKGDQSAWNEVVDRFQRLVISIPRRAGLDEEQASDIFQDVFVTLLEKINELEQPEKLRSWLVTTAKFKTWQLIRGTKRNTSIDDDEEAGVLQLADKGESADDGIIALEQQHIVRTAVNQLEQKCRIILTMLYLSEPAFSYLDVAKKIGVGETSISPMRARCLKKLAKVLG